jgi:hypothetical protein
VVHLLSSSALRRRRPAAPAGVTALAGRVLARDGAPLANVALRDGGVGTRSDAQGRFLLSGIAPGASVLAIDGRHAGPGSAADYGYYEVAVRRRSHRYATGLPTACRKAPK